MSNHCAPATNISYLDNAPCLEEAVPFFQTGGQGLKSGGDGNSTSKNIQGLSRLSAKTTKVNTAAVHDGRWAQGRRYKNMTLCMKIETSSMVQRPYIAVLSTLGPSKSTTRQNWCHAITTSGVGTLTLCTL